jgi:hypothetical protein
MLAAFPLPATTPFRCAHNSASMCGHHTHAGAATHRCLLSHFNRLDRRSSLCNALNVLQTTIDRSAPPLRITTQTSYCYLQHSSTSTDDCKNALSTFLYVAWQDELSRASNACFTSYLRL